MTFRERLADLISGGALTRDIAINRINGDTIKSNENAARSAHRDAMVFAGIAKKYGAALREIAAEAKPTSNATVRRMARIAREALK